MNSLEWFVFIVCSIYIVAHGGDWLLKRWHASLEAEWARERAERQRIARQMIQEYRRAEYEKAMRDTDRVNGDRNA